MKLAHIPVSVILLTLLSAAAAAAPLKPLAFTFRNGGNTAYCGLFGSGLAASHSFAAAAPTEDVITFSDPGGSNFPPSSTQSTLEAWPWANGLVLAGAGSAQRGALEPEDFGVSATADARDFWTFTVAVPTRFAFTATVSAASTEPTVPGSSYSFGPYGGGAQIVPDPGTFAGPFGAALSVPGSITHSGSGTLLPGQYAVTLNGRCEGSTWPYSGSFANHFGLVLGAFGELAPALPPPLLLRHHDSTVHSTGPAAPQPSPGGGDGAEFSRAGILYGRPARRTVLESALATARSTAVASGKTATGSRSSSACAGYRTSV